MSKLLKQISDPSSEVDAEDDVAVATAVQRAMEFYGCDAVTAAAHRGIEAWVLKRQGEFTFWLHIFNSLKAHGDHSDEISQPG
ncbi:hypothetical protein [Ensifer aridi]|uniref:hypothetical protein n=1 Tax=Ensifer aridi TaxID=1708715 RepID=UPI00040380A6|nr:hypothetical protein [Ensifer aridi]